MNYSNLSKNRKLFLFPVFLMLLLSFACKTSFVKNTEAIDDEIAFQKAVQSNAQISNSVTATFETNPVITNKIGDDAADDPAFWYNTSNPSKSIIFGSNKKRGIHSYNLQGDELQFIDCGKINNIDVRQDVAWNKQQVAILAGSNRSDNSIDLFIINSEGKINKTADYKIQLGDFVPYGFCLYKTVAHQIHAFVNDKNGAVKQIEIAVTEKGDLHTKTIRHLKLKTQVEGMVVDDISQKLFVGEEQGGIHVFSAEANGNNSSFLLKGSTEANKNIRYDIEGLALISPNYLLASSQGNFSYAIFDLQKNTYINSFKISEGIVDAVEETDGLEVITKNLGKDFPQGILIVQDGFNYDATTKKNQNFKIVNFKKIIDLLPKK